jgi:hypothetical protein
VRALFVSSVRGFGGGEEWFATAPALLRERGHHAVLAARAGEALAAEGRKRGVTVFDVPFGGVLDPRALAMLHDILASERIDVAVTNLDKETRVLALAALGDGRIALVPRRGVGHPARGRRGQSRAVGLSGSIACWSIRARSRKRCARACRRSTRRRSCCCRTGSTRSGFRTRSVRGITRSGPRATARA